MSGQSRQRSDIGLAFETSCALGSIALSEGDTLLEARTFTAPRQHAREFLPTINALCAAHDVSPREVQYIYVSKGPGSFTGLRIGVTVARMLALSVAAKVVAVSTLDAIAHNALEHPAPPKRLAVILDAKRERVYAASFARRGDGYEATSQPAELDPWLFLKEQDEETWVMGEGVPYHQQAVGGSQLAVLPAAYSRPKAEAVFRLGWERAKAGKTESARDFVPTYVRLPEAEEKWAERQQAKETEGEQDT